MMARGVATVFRHAAFSQDLKYGVKTRYDSPPPPGRTAPGGSTVTPGTVSTQSRSSRSRRSRRWA